MHTMCVVCISNNYRAAELPFDVNKMHNYMIIPYLSESLFVKV